MAFDLLALFIPDANPLTAIGIVLLIISIAILLWVPFFKFEAMLGILASIVLIFVPSIIVNYLKTQEGILVALGILIVVLFLYREGLIGKKGKKK